MKKTKHTRNESAARKYLADLRDALDRRDFSMIDNEPPPEIDWTQLPQSLLDEFEELNGRTGEIYETEVRGGEV